VLCINTDITERKKMEAHLLRAQRMESIGTLAGGIAHDLNNLLAPVVMGVELLRHFGIEGPAREVVDNIERSARRGTSLVKQVLTFARGAEGARVAVHLGTALQEIEAMISGTFPKSIILTTEVAPNLWLTSGDPTQIHQVLLNFCVNARDAMPDGGSILVKVENAAIETSSSQPGIPAGRYVLITVEDTGCGIPPRRTWKRFSTRFSPRRN
jgi:signal transduction histidine kinase